MGISVGGRGKGPKRDRRPTRIVRGQAQKPFRPLENPFPSKGDFRFGVYLILPFGAAGEADEEQDDYIVCRGYDPLAKNPFAEITPDAPRTIKVAKPPLLLRSPWDGEIVQINGIAYTYTYDDAEVGVRTVTWSDADGDHEEEQRVDPPYFAGDLLVAVCVRRNQAQDGMEVNGEIVKDNELTNLSWVDLNVSGRHWKGACPYYWEFEINGGDPSSGSQVWSVTINADTQDVTIDFDMTAAELKTEFLSEFIGLTSVDLDVTGGPLPRVPLTVKWKEAVANDVVADWPPTVGTNSLNGSAWMKVRQLNPRG